MLFLFLLKSRHHKNQQFLVDLFIILLFVLRKYFLQVFNAQICINIKPLILDEVPNIFYFGVKGRRINDIYSNFRIIFLRLIILWIKPNILHNILRLLQNLLENIILTNHQYWFISVSGKMNRVPCRFLQKFFKGFLINFRIFNSNAY